jgi:hypothetical protein
MTGNQQQQQQQESTSMCGIGVDNLALDMQFQTPGGTLLRTSAPQRMTLLLWLHSQQASIS